MTETLKDMITRHEGLRLKPYTDTVGKLTIGVGRNLIDVGISKAEAMLLLDNDIQDATAKLFNALPWTGGLDFPRKCVLISMAFNMGIGGLTKFKDTLSHIEKSEWQQAHDAMLDSVWAKQTGMRAIELARIILTGEMPEGA